MTDKRQQVIERLKKKARRHYYASEIPEHLDCGRHMASNINAHDGPEGEALAYENCVARLRRIDPDFPKGARQ